MYKDKYNASYDFDDYGEFQIPILLRKSYMYKKRIRSPWGFERPIDD